MSILKLTPACKDYLWGGTKLITDYGKRYDGARLAETWELSGHPDGPSVLASGPDAGKTLAEYLAAHPGALGEHGRKFAELPVLIKLIDAAKDLSIQEMWYVLSAEPDAFLYCGFSRDISRDELKRRIADNTLPEVLRRVNVKAGDTVFIPAGTIHAICRGIVVAEVQQSSNVTYRVCDYGRLAPDGKPRALHIAQALDVTRRTVGVPTPDFGGHLARCDYFTVDLLAAPQAATCGAESFLSLLILDGEGEVRCGSETVRAKKGHSLFLPAGSGEVRLTGTLRALATRI